MRVNMVWIFDDFKEWVLILVSVDLVVRFKNLVFMLLKFMLKSLWMKWCDVCDFLQNNIKYVYMVGREVV